MAWINAGFGAATGIIVIALLWGLACVLAVGAFRQQRRNVRTQLDCTMQTQRNALALTEIEHGIVQLRRIAQAQQFTESAVHIGTQTVRQIHMGIATLPFTLLEAMPATRDTTRIVRRTHNLIANVVYGGIRGANRASGSLAREALGSAATPRKPSDTE